MHVLKSDDITVEIIGGCFYFNSEKIDIFCDIELLTEEQREVVEACITLLKRSEQELLTLERLCMQNFPHSKLNSSSP